eukprot:7385309-Prymnesium_polylepis.1
MHDIATTNERASIIETLVLAPSQHMCTAGSRAFESTYPAAPPPGRLAALRKSAVSHGDVVQP